MKLVDFRVTKLSTPSYRFPSSSLRYPIAISMCWNSEPAQRIHTASDADIELAAPVRFVAMQYDAKRMMGVTLNFRPSPFVPSSVEERSPNIDSLIIHAADP